MVTTFRQRRRHAKTLRTLRRLIDEAPTATVRNDLLAIAARNEPLTTLLA